MNEFCPHNFTSGYCAFKKCNSEEAIKKYKSREQYTEERLKSLNWIFKKHRKKDKVSKESIVLAAIELENLKRYGGNPPPEMLTREMIISVAKGRNQIKTIV